MTAFVIASIAGAARPLLAAQRELPHIELSGPPTCIDARKFQDRLSALPASSAPTPLPRAITIDVMHGDGKFTGEVEVTHQDGTTSSRHVSSTNCDEVADALELIAAVAMGLEMPAPRERPAPPPDPIVADQRAVWRLSGALRGAAIGGAAPNVELGPQIALGTRLEARGWLAPSFELSFMWPTSSDIDKSDARGSRKANLELAGGAATVCPARFSLGAFAFRPCSELAIGSLRGIASGVEVLGGATRQTWIAVGALARIEWAPARSIRLDADLGPYFPLNRARFYFTGPPEIPVYDVPGVVVSPRLGVTVLFP